MLIFLAGKFSQYMGKIKLTTLAVDGCNGELSKRRFCRISKLDELQIPKSHKDVYL